jgi:putative ABC transport system ATP-binding protein
MVQNWPQEKRHARVMELLEAVGMSEQAHKRPDQLSGGQKQRVAVARALVTQSRLVLADEPTANLDSTTAHKVIDLMKDMREQFGTTFIFSTHDTKVMAEAEITFTLIDGEIAEKRVEVPRG